MGTLTRRKSFFFPAMEPRVASAGANARSPAAKIAQSLSSYSEVEAEAREDPAAFLRALMELGDESSGTYCRATLPTRGADLTIGPDGFEILEPSKGSTKEGTFTCSA